MTSESADSVSLKIWDRTVMDTTLESVAQDLAAPGEGSKRPHRYNSKRVRVDITATLSRDDAYPDPFQEVPC